MKVNFKLPVTDLSGNPLKEKKEDAIVDKTIEQVVCTSLFAAQAQKSGENSEEAYRTYKLLRRVMESVGDVEISVEEAAVIKREVAKNYVVGVCGQVFDCIERAQD